MRRLFRGGNAPLLLAFAGLALLVLSVARLLTVFAFGDWGDLLRHSGDLPPLLWMGLRFDVKVIATLVLLLYWVPNALIGWRCSQLSFNVWLRRSLLVALCGLLLLIFGELGYWIFFDGPIDVLVFGFLEDDTWAVLSTVAADWRLFAVTIGYVVVAVVLAIVFLRASRTSSVTILAFTRLQTTGLQLLLLLLLVLLARGSLGTFPLRASHASISDSSFINSVVMNSVFNLQNALDDRSASGINRRAVDVLRAANVSEVAQLETLAGFAERPLIATSSTKSGPLPHVVMVLKEGWSTEIALGQSDTNQVLGSMAEHFQQDYYFRNFISNAYGTNPSIEALLLNSPITPLSQSPARNVTFPMSNVLPFKRAGYRTIFISGGDSGWRNHEYFWAAQGFDSYIGRAAIEKHFNVAAADNPWGTYDEYVFAYLKFAVQQAQADGVPLFAFVLTTNNHPPVRLPASYQAPPLDPAVYGFAADNTVIQNTLQGFHYQTDQLGQWLSWLKQSALKDSVILAATGDHILKGFTDYQAVERGYLRYSVPSYFYVPPALDQLKNIDTSVVGSHQDIFPTLFELALSEAHYYQFGTAFMAKQAEFAYGFMNEEATLLPRGIYYMKTGLLYCWADEAKILLEKTATPLAETEKKMLQDEAYRRLLKEWLLLHAYERPATQ